MTPLKGLLVNDASLLGHHGSAIVTAQAQRLARDAGIELAVGYDWNTVDRLLSGTHDFAVVIVNGEGSLHHDSKTAKRIAWLGHRLETSTPAFLINASEEQNSAMIYEGLAKYRAIYVRDRPSQLSLAHVGIKSEIVHDLTLTWNACPIASGSGTVWVTDASEQAKARMLCAYARRFGAQSISLRTAPPTPRGTLPRRRIAFELKRLVGYVAPEGPWKLRYTQSIRHLDDFIARMTNHTSGLVSGRFHGVCLAIRMRLPFVTVSAGTTKVENLLSEMGLEDRLIDPIELDRTTTPLKIAPFSKFELEAIQTFLLRTERDAQEMFDSIASQVRCRSIRT